MKREGVATTVTDTPHHRRPRSGGVGVEVLIGFYDVPRDTSAAALDTQTESETEIEGSYDLAP